MVLFKIRVTDQGVGPAGQRQSGAGAGEMIPGPVQNNSAGPGTSIKFVKSNF